MNNLISVFMGVSRGFHEASAEKLDVNALIENIADEFELFDSNIQLLLEGEPLIVKAHQLALKRIIHNLLDNAVRYSQQHKVEVCIKSKKRCTHIVIADRGPGLNAAQRKAVFEPFYRIESSRNAETGGLGLGLSIVKQLADAHHYKISLLPRTGGGLYSIISIPYTSVP